MHMGLDDLEFSILQDSPNAGPCRIEFAMLLQSMLK